MLIISLNMHFTGRPQGSLNSTGKNYIRLNLGTFDTPRHKILTGFPLSMLNDIISS